MRKIKIMNGMIFYILLLTFSCTQVQERDATEEVSDTVNVTNVTNADGYQCDLEIKSLPQKSLSFTNIETIDKNKLTPVDDQFYAKYLENHFGTRGNENQFYYYSNVDEMDCAILIYHEQTIDETSRELYLMNKPEKRGLGIMLISANLPYPDSQIEIKSIERSGKLLLIKTVTSIGDYDQATDQYSEIRDSITSTYFIKEGSLVLSHTDSIRLN